MMRSSDFKLPSTTSSLRGLRDQKTTRITKLSIDLRVGLLSLAMPSSVTPQVLLGLLGHRERPPGEGCRALLSAAAPWAEPDRGGPVVASTGERKRHVSAEEGISLLTCSLMELHWPLHV